MNKNLKRFILFIIVGFGIIISYLFLISLYTRLAKDPIIFFVSLAIAFFLSIAFSVLIYKIGKKQVLFDTFSAFLCALVYFFGLVVFITFGPVFIDRSISYHLAFYATEEEAILIEDIRDEFSDEIFEKRIHDALETGFLKQNADGSCSPSNKAKFMTAILLPLGKMSGSLGTYETMKEKLKNK